MTRRGDLSVCGGLGVVRIAFSLQKRGLRSLVDLPKREGGYAQSKGE